MSVLGDIVRESRYIDDKVYVSFDEENYRKLELKLKIQEGEIERLNNIIKHVENICESSIASIDNYLLEEKETKIVNGRCTNRNGYQIERLKAYRTKSKEILGRIKELKGSNNMKGGDYGNNYNSIDN